MWCYIAAEYATSVQKGGQHDLTLRLLADALIGGLESSHRSSRIQPFRIFRCGSSTLNAQQHVLLCIGAPLHAQGASVARLAEKVIPQVDLKRLAQVDGISEPPLSEYAKQRNRAGSAANELLPIRPATLQILSCGDPPILQVAWLRARPC